LKSLSTLSQRTSCNKSETVVVAPTELAALYLALSLHFRKFLMRNSSVLIPTVPSPKRGVPRSLWIGGGLLALVAAALAGALITRSIDAASVPGAQAAPEGTAPIQATADRAATSAQKSHDTHAVAPICTNCGTVESVRQVELEGKGTGLGAVAGGVAGGLLGNQFGSGKGKTAMTVVGAVGGGLAGNQVEKKARSETAYRVSVRMQDGSVGTFQQSQSFAVGTKVVVDGHNLRLASNAVGQ
jgi:outer membrane lipoprotein SlyB